MASESMFALLTQISAEDDAEEYELQKLGSRIKLELARRATIRKQTEMLHRNMEIALNTLRNLENGMNAIKASQKDAIKRMYDYETVAHSTFESELNRQREEHAFLEQKWKYKQTKVETEWMKQIESMDQEFERLQLENNDMKQQINDHQLKIKENESTFSDLQKEIESKRESIASIETETEQSRKQGNEAQIKLTASKQRTEELEQKVARKEAEIEQLKLDELQIANNLEMLKTHQADDEKLKEEKLKMDELKQNNIALQAESEAIQNEIDALWIEMDSFRTQNVYPLQAQIELKLKPDLEQKQREIAELKQEEDELQKQMLSLQSEFDEIHERFEQKQEEKQILSTKYNEKHNRYLQRTQRLNELRRELVAKRDGELQRERNWVHGLRQSHHKLKKYMAQKQENALFVFTAKETKRDFGIDAKEENIEVFGDAVKNLHDECKRESEEIEQLSELTEGMKVDEVAKEEAICNELETESIAVRREYEAAQKESKKRREAVDKVENEERAILEAQQQEMQKKVEALQAKMKCDKERYEETVNKWHEEEGKVLYLIDQLKSEREAILKPVEDELDEMSKQNIDKVHELTTQCNERKRNYKRLKVELRQSRRRSSANTNV